MLGDMWSSSELAAEQIGITEIKLSFLRENGLLKPGIHWKSSPLGQKKPWKPKALYNIKMCRKVVNKLYSEENYNLAAWKPTYIFYLLVIHNSILLNSHPYTQLECYAKLDIS